MSYSHSLVRPFNPRMLSGLVLWLDAADPAGTGVLPANASAVSTWKDKSIKGNDHTQGSGANQPTFNTNQINGLPAITFTASKYLSGTSSGFPSGSSARTCFIVFNTTSASTAQYSFLYGTSTTNQYWGLLDIGAPFAVNNALFIDTNGKGAYGSTSLANNLTYLAEMNYAAGGNVSTTGIVLNGLSQTVTPNVDAVPNTTLSFSYVSSSGTPGTFGTIGQICEILLFDTALSATNQLRVRKYLSSKWGINTIANQTSGLKLWLDASNPLGTSILPADATAVSSWVDLSLTGNTVSQGTGANQPVLKRSILNNRSVVRFDGTNDLLQKTSATTLGSKVTMFAVGISNGNGSNGRGTYFDYSTNSATNTGANITHNGASDGGPKLALSYFDGTLDQGQSSTITLPYTAILYTYNDGSNAYLYSNGVQVATIVTGNISGTPNVYTIGALFGPAAGWFLNGDIAEILFFIGQLTAGQISTLMSYLSTKYGISVTL